MKKIFALVLLMALSFGCGKEEQKAPADSKRDPVKKAEQQAKAVRAYKELTEKYPDSPYAEQARQRLSELQPGQ